MKQFTQALVDRTPRFAKKLSKDRRVVSKKGVVRHDRRMKRNRFL